MDILAREESFQQKLKKLNTEIKVIASEIKDNNTAILRSRAYAILGKLKQELYYFTEDPLIKATNTEYSKLVAKLKTKLFNAELFNDEHYLLLSTYSDLLDRFMAITDLSQNQEYVSIGRN